MNRRTKEYQTQGFTLIEIMVSLAILAILTATFYWISSPDQKIKNADFLVLKQILVVNIPGDLRKWYLRSATDWRNQITKIDIEMEDWPSLTGTRSANIYSVNGLELNFTTTFDKKKNNELKSLLEKLPSIKSITTSDTNNQKFVVKYKLN